VLLRVSFMLNASFAAFNVLECFCGENNAKNDVAIPRSTVIFVNF